MIRLLPRAGRRELPSIHRRNRAEHPRQPDCSLPASHRRANNMRMLSCAVALIVSDAVLSGANAFEGKWKMSPQGSKYTAGSLPKEEVIAIADKGNQLEVTIAGTDDDGKPIAI